MGNCPDSHPARSARARITAQSSRSVQTPTGSLALRRRMSARTKVAAWAAVAVAMLCRCVPAMAAPAAAEPVLEYEVTEAGTGRVLFTAWGWTEATEADPESVAVLSRTVFPQRG